MPIDFENGLIGIITVIIAGFIGSLMCHKIDVMKVE